MQKFHSKNMYFMTVSQTIKLAQLEDRIIMSFPFRRDQKQPKCMATVWTFFETLGIKVNHVLIKSFLKLLGSVKHSEI